VILLSIAEVLGEGGVIDMQRRRRKRKREAEGKYHDAKASMRQ